MSLKFKVNYFIFYKSIKRCCSSYTKLIKNSDHNQNLNAKLDESSQIKANFFYLNWLCNKNEFENFICKHHFKIISSLSFSNLDELSKIKILKLLYLYSKIFVSFKHNVINEKEFNLLLDKVLEDLENFLINCNLMQISIFCESLFKLKIKLNQKTVSLIFKNTIEKTLKENCSSYQLVNFSKFLRINSYFNEDYITFIANQIKTLNNQFNFIQLCHILAFFANFAYYHHKLIENMINKGFDCLEQEMLCVPIKIRCKDIRRFLWSIAFLNHPTERFDSIFNLIISKIALQFYDYPHFLLDCVKSSIIYGNYPISTINLFLNDLKFIEKLAQTSKDKTFQDLYFILESIKVEKPNINLKEISSLVKLTKPPVQDDLKMLNRTNFFKLTYSNLKERGQVKIIYPLKHFSLPSLLLDENIYEILDSYVCLRNVNYKPSGLLNCKLRQMSLKNIQFQVVKSLTQISLKQKE